MFATVRRYAGLNEPGLTEIIARAADIAAVLASVPGVVASQLIRTRDGVILVTVGSDEACLAESGRRFRAWVREHAGGLRTADEADVWAGVLLHQWLGGPPST